MNKKLLVFDFDGVLREFSWEVLFATYKKMGEYLKIDFLEICQNLDIFRKWHDHNWRSNLLRMGVRDEDVVVKLVGIFNKNYDSQVKVFPWAGQIIGRLSENYEIAVLSNSFSSSIRDSLNGFSHKIPMIVGSDCVVQNKPNPEGLELIMWKLGAKPSNTWMIGDTMVDILTGRGAGTKTIAVTWGATTLGSEFEEMDADLILRAPSDLLAMNF